MHHISQAHNERAPAGSPLLIDSDITIHSLDDCLFSAVSLSSAESNRRYLKLLLNSSSRGANIYRAVYNVCEPHSYVLLLEHDEHLANNNIIDELVQYLTGNN